MALRERPDGLRQHEGACPVQVSQVDRPVVAVFQMFHLFEHLVVAIEQLFAPLDERPPDARQVHPVLSPQEDLDPQLLLHVGNVLAQHRLGDEIALRGLREAQGSG